VLHLLLALFTPASAGPVDTFTEVVDAHRDGVVLMASSAELYEGQRLQVPVLGTLVHHERRLAVAALTEALLADVPRARADKGRDIEEFLRTLESDPSLRDGDKLAFLEVLDALRIALQGAPEGKKAAALTARVASDLEAIQAVELRYREEMRALLGTSRTRGMRLTREQWDAYIDATRAQRPVDGIFARFASELASNVPGTRGLRDNPLEVYGTSLPEGTFVLTFDDGPHAEHTSEVLATLAETGTSAVFFQVGEHVKANPELAARVLEEGHWLGSHSWSHKNLPTLDDAGLAAQLDLANTMLDDASGSDVVLFRPPYGGRDGRVLEALKDRGTQAYLWNVDSVDWADPIPESIAQTVIEQVRSQKRGVILLHDVHPQTVAALPLILEMLKAEGVKLVLWDGQTPPGEEPVLAAAEPSLYTDSWAVVIGINRYDSWPRLAYAVQDAQGIRDALVDTFGFDDDHVITLIDGEATKARILEVLGDELPSRVGPEDRVFVFYAGHGATRVLPSGAQRGFVVPVDGDAERLQSTAISMSVLDDIQEGLSAKHVMFVMDACYSGVALTRSGGATGDPRRYLQEATRRRARQILTAGGADEQVADHGPGGHSIFTWTMLQGMQGAADLSGDGFITASELSSFVAPRVSALSAQTPVFGNLVGSEGGEFVFTLDPDQALLSELSGTVSSPTELARAKEQLQAANDELQKELAQMQAQLSALQAGRGGGLDPVAEAQRLHREGLVAFRAGDVADAYTSLRRAAELDPTNPEIVNNVGFLLQVLGQQQEARQWLERAIGLDGERAVAYLNLGDTCQALGDRDAAVAAYGRYLEMVPDSSARRGIEAFLGRSP
jgi:peptidoglycan/xylan/chitin deacetylase (PgdA/CDA1 family)/uncharacterized caspase-like protein